MKLHEIQETSEDSVRQWLGQHTTYNPATIDVLMASHYYSGNNVLSVSYFMIGNTGSDFTPPPFHMVVTGSGKLQFSDIEIENINFDWLTEADTISAACAGYGESVGDATALTSFPM